MYSMRLSVPKDRWAISDGTMFQLRTHEPTAHMGSVGSRPVAWDMDQKSIMSLV